MHGLGEQLATYLHLARALGRRGLMFDRDRLLVLAGVVATWEGLPRIADCCRRKVLEHIPGHMLRRWPDFRAALNHEDFVCYFQSVYRRFPIERAETMLQQWQLEVPAEGPRIEDPERYAEQLLGLDPDFGS